MNFRTVPCSKLEIPWISPVKRFILTYIFSPIMTTSIKFCEASLQANTSQEAVLIYLLWLCLVQGHNKSKLIALANWLNKTNLFVVTRYQMTFKF